MVGRARRSKGLAFVLALVLALTIVPFVGTAVANHGGAGAHTAEGNPVLTPESDTAVYGACNQFTATATEQNNQGQQVAAGGEAVEITATQGDPDTAADLTIAFCDPTTADEPGDQPAAASDTDDDGGAENPAVIEGVCVTEGTDDPATQATNEGQCVFGVTSNDTNQNGGPMTVTVCTTDERDVQRCDTSTKTWITQTQAARQGDLECEPESAFNPEGGVHTFTCTVTYNGQPLQGAEVSYDVTAGPNAEQGPTPCAADTDAEGQAECTLDDPPHNPPTTDSPPGTDTIVAFINDPQCDPRQQQQCSPGPDPHEAQDTITKTWVGPANAISCVPDGAQADSGTVQTVTCTVTDVNGNPVPNVQVDFTETGPGRFITQSTDLTTDQNGQVQVEVQTAANETGTQTVTGTIDPTPEGAAPTGGFAPTNCGPPAAQGAQCSDNASYNWRPPEQPPPTRDCADGSDNDGDGEIDYPNDRGCRSADDISEAGPFATTLTIRYNRLARAFKGQAASSQIRCQIGRRVTIKKVRRGPDRVIGRDLTNRDGNYRVPWPRRRGRYYGIVARKTYQTRSGDIILCMRDRSVTIAIRPRRG